MNQPDLGKKIAELRKAKGFTQEELVEKCNLSVRTLQRIESGEVAPRSYTLKLIFTALDYNIHEASENITGRFDESRLNVSKWPGQFFRYVLDLFNFKTNPMKKITILAVTMSAIFLGTFVLCSESKAQKAEKAIKAIEEAQDKGNNWMKEGKIDSVLTLYRDDATVFPNLSGKAEIRQMLQDAADGGFKLKEFRNISISVSDSIAVQKYYDVYEFQGVEYHQKGMTEWRLTKGKWLTVNDIMNNY
jgi:transcriptional regulator with XRE-family HTH domain